MSTFEHLIVVGAFALATIATFAFTIAAITIYRHADEIVDSAVNFIKRHWKP